MKTDLVRVVDLPAPAWAALFAAVLLSGCGTLGPVQDMTRFYNLGGEAVLGTAGATPAAAPDATMVGVRVVQSATHLRRPGIVVRVSEHELRYAAGHRWAERLDEAVARGTADGLQLRLGGKVIVAVAPSLRAPLPDVLVEVELLRCEGRSGTEAGAIFAADWRIVGDNSPKPLAAGRFRVEKPGWDGSDYAQLSALLAAAVDEFAASLTAPVTTAVSN